jgi:hypothetical protein
MRRHRPVVVRLVVAVAVLLGLPAGGLAQEPAAGAAPAAAPAAPTTAAPAPAAAAPGPGHALLLQATVGGVFPFGDLGLGPAVRLGLGYAPPLLGGRAALLVEVGYTQGSRAVTAFDPRLGPDGGDLTARLTQRELGLFVGPRVQLRDPGRRLVPHVSAGLAVHFLQTTVSGETAGVPFGESRERGTAVGFAVAGGVAYRLGPGAVVGEVTCSWAPLDLTVTGESHLGRIALVVGYAARLPLGR